MQNLRCNYCKRKSFKTLFTTKDYLTGKEIKIIKCRNCFLVFTCPTFNNLKLEKYYTGYRQESGKRFPQPIEKLLNFWHLKRAASISKFKKRGVVLDIGCGRGVEIEKLQELGWKAYGTEYYHNSKLQFGKKKLNIFLGNFWEANYAGSFFDVIAMWHSLEHITNLLKTVSEIKRILKKRGILIIAVPNFDSWERVLSNNNWFHLDIPRHRYHFSDKILCKLLEKSGFEIVNVKYVAPEYDFYSFLQTFLNKLPFYRKALIYKLLNKEEKANLLLSVQAVSQMPFAIVIGMLSIFFVPLSWIFKKSGTIELTAVKL